MAQKTAGKQFRRRHTRAGCRMRPFLYGDVSKEDIRQGQVINIVWRGLAPRLFCKKLGKNFASGPHNVG